MQIDVLVKEKCNSSALAMELYPNDDVIKWKHFPHYCVENSPVTG